jgi:hypothetical protein
VHQLDQESATRTQCAVHLGEDSAVLGVVEVAIGGEPAHHRIEAVRPGNGAHVPLYVFHAHAEAVRVGTRHIQKERRCVQPGHPGTHASEPVGDAAMAAGQVQDLRAIAQGKEGPDRRRFLVGRVVGEAPGEEVQVVLIE